MRRSGSSVTFAVMLSTGTGFTPLVLKTSGDVIGDCGLVTQQIEGRPELEVGYHLRRDQWGRGYATEAAHGCMEFAFGVLHAPKVISLIRPENLPSRRVAERNGMQVEREVMHGGLMHLMYAASKLSALSHQPSARSSERDTKAATNDCSEKKQAVTEMLIADS